MIKKVSAVINNFKIIFDLNGIKDMSVYLFLCLFICQLFLSIILLFWESTVTDIRGYVRNKRKVTYCKFDMSFVSFPKSITHTHDIHVHIYIIEHDKRCSVSLSHFPNKVYQHQSTHCLLSISLTFQCFELHLN